MRGDGNCQFRSFSSQLFHTQDHHMAVRKAAVRQIQQNRALYSAFFEGEGDMNQYIRSMGLSGTWGDEITLKAVADVFGITVHVLTSNDSFWNLEYKPEKQLVDRHVFLSYISPVHYNSVFHVDHEIPSHH